MTITEAVRARRSVRTFDGTPLKEEDAKQILDFAQKVENPYDIPIEWRILDAKKKGLSSPVITGTDCYIAGKLARVPFAEEAFGYTFEKIVLFAQTLGVGTTWIAGTMDRKAFEAAMDLAEGEVMPCVSPLGYPAKKMSLRETLMRKGVKADWRMDPSELFFSCNPETFENTGKFEPLGENAPEEFKLPLELVRLAPSAVNKQPWRVVVAGNMAHFYEKRSKGYVADNGWDLQKVDMGIALCHFEAGAQAQDLKTSVNVEDPGLEVGDLIYIATVTIGV